MLPTTLGTDAMATTALIHKGMAVNETDEEYHASEPVSRSKLWTLHTKSPAHMRYEEPKESKALDTGKLLHLAVLQPELIGRRYVVAEPMNKNTNAWKELVARAAADGKILITTPDYDVAMKMAEVAHRESVVLELLKDSVIEQSYYWTHEATGMAIKARPDIYSRRIKVQGDYKTTRSAAPRQFAKSVAEYGYHLQEAIYGEGGRAVGHDVDGFVFIAQEKEAPYVVSLFELSPEDLAEAQTIYSVAMARYAKCVREDHWPAYGEGVQMITMPNWAFTEWEPHDEDV